MLASLALVRAVPHALGGQETDLLRVAGKRVRSGPRTGGPAAAPGAARAASAEWWGPQPAHLVAGMAKAAAVFSSAPSDAPIDEIEKGDAGFVAVVASLLAAGAVSLVPVTPVRMIRRGLFRFCAACLSTAHAFLCHA
jgi:hypothetical protein